MNENTGTSPLSAAEVPQRRVSEDASSGTVNVMDSVGLKRSTRLRASVYAAQFYL